MQKQYVTDGNAVFEIEDFRSNINFNEIKIAEDTTIIDNISLGYRKNSSAYPVGSMAYSSGLPTGYYLLCVEAGFSGAARPDFTGKTVDDIVTDGAVKWVIKCIDSGNTTNGIQLADVTGVQVDAKHARAMLRWTDPDDAMYSGSKIAEWAGTKIVRKAESAPANLDDGVLVLDSKTKNAYATTAYTDSGLTDGTTYYYRFFPYTKAGVYTIGTTVSVIPSTSSVIVPSTNDVLTYDGSTKAPNWNDLDLIKISTGGTLSAINAGEYTAVFSLISEDYTWSDGTTAAKNVTWSIGKASVSVPSVTNTSKTYTGNAQGPIIGSYDSSIISVTGNSATEAGNYNVVFSLINSNYQWNDSTTANKNVAWSIAKASPNIVLSPTSLTLSSSKLTGTVSVTRNGSGTVSASSSSTSIATVSVSGTTITVTAKSNGSATITVSVAANGNYNSASKTFSVTCNLMPALKDATPAQIKSVAQAGTARNYWDIGDYIEMTLNGSWACVDKTITLSNYVVRCVLIGINHNASKEGNNMLHFQMGKNTDGVDIAFYYSKMNTSSTNSSGWKSSAMRTKTMANLYNLIPSNWRNVIKACTKYSDNTGGGSDTASYVTSTSDNCWLLAEYEVFGSRSYANSAEQNYQQQYEYYKNGNSKVRYTHDSPTSAGVWWLRSVFSTNANSFCFVNINGSAGYGNAIIDFRVAPGFCIG